MSGISSRTNEILAKAGFNGEIRELLPNNIDDEIVEVNQYFPDKAFDMAKLAIETMTVGQYIQSKDYVAGVSGFKIEVNSDGQGVIWANVFYASEYRKVFVQDDEPASGMSAGDIWYDSNDSMKQYIYSGAAWVLTNVDVEWADILDGATTKPVDNATDDTVANAAQGAASAAQGDADTAITNAAAAQGTADGKVTTFYQDEAPTAEGTGDLWVDTNDGNKLYRASATGSANWVEVQDDDIATAISNASTAQSTADGKIVTFYQSAVPTATDVGDIFHDTDDGKTYRSTNIGDDQITAGEWERIDTGLYPTLIDALQTTNAPADAGATEGAIAGTNFTGAGTNNNEVDDDGIVTRLLNAIFGDGSDGTVIISSNTTLTSDMYYNDLTINSGFTLNTGGYRVFVKGTLTVNGNIGRDGNDGSAGGDGSGQTAGALGAGGALLANGSLQGSLVGPDGAAGGTGVTRSDGGGEVGIAGGAGTNGANAEKSLGFAGEDGSVGGKGGSLTPVGRAGGAAGAGGTGGTLSGTVFNTINTITGAYIMADFEPAAQLLENSASSASGGGGGSGAIQVDASASSATSGGGGGSGGTGSSGGIVSIFARIIVIGASGVISCNGGDGGDGGDAGTGSRTGTSTYSGSGGGAGGNGGHGGVLVLIYNQLTNSGSITSNGGAAGAIGAGNSGAGNYPSVPPEPGDNGVIGTAGTNKDEIILEV